MTPPPCPVSTARGKPRLWSCDMAGDAWRLWPCCSAGGRAGGGEEGRHAAAMADGRVSGKRHCGCRQDIPIPTHTQTPHSHLHLSPAGHTSLDPPTKHLPYICGYAPPPPTCIPHTRTTLSSEAEATALSSHAMARSLITPMWPRQVRCSAPVVRDHIWGAVDVALLSHLDQIVVIQHMSHSPLTGHTPHSPP